MTTALSINYNTTMREIKFRAWNVNEKQMYAEWPLIPWPRVEERLNQVFENPHWVFLQYTGLHDKNGKEIYEGDIVVERGRTADAKDWIREIPPYPDKLYHWVGEGLFRPEYNEVIGNIYENPELLN